MSEKEQIKDLIDQIDDKAFLDYLLMLVTLLLSK